MKGFRAKSRLTESLARNITLHFTINPSSLPWSLCVSLPPWNPTPVCDFHQGRTCDQQLPRSISCAEIFRRWESTLPINHKLFSSIQVTERWLSLCGQVLGELDHRMKEKVSAVKSTPHLLRDHLFSSLLKPWDTLINLESKAHQQERAFGCCRFQTQYFQVLPQQVGK